MKLSELFSGTDMRTPIHDREVFGVCSDTRRLIPDAVFFCVRGLTYNGHDYAEYAYAQGCRVFVADEFIELPPDADVYMTHDSRETLAIVAENYFGRPDREIRLIGVTGTKGKTSTALMVREILQANGIPTGYIGTNGVLYANHKEETHNTTPEAPLLARYFSEMLRAGVRTVVMEVSSQAIRMKRIFGLKFDICAFTNLSPDHIGPYEHPDFEDYRACKQRLFHTYGCNTVIVNQDDENAAFMTAQTNAKVIRCSAEVKDADYFADGYRQIRTAAGPGGTYTLNGIPCKLPFPGKFSMYNAMLATAIAAECGVTPAASARALQSAKIAGRYERIPLPNGASVMIDYAHNGASLSSILDTLRGYAHHRLICLFGSVGNRTFGRRRELALAAATRADLCILTADNPDTEDPEAIAKQIASYFPPDGCAYRIIPDRKQAITYAVGIAEPGDLILLAGKGHENYQYEYGKYVPFSERDIVRNAIRAAYPEKNTHPQPK